MSQLSAILQVKNRIAVHTIASVRHESMLKVAVLTISAILLWLGLLTAFLEGFLWLRDFMPESRPDVVNIGDILMVRLLAIFALALFFMLIFSNILIVFSTLYKSREVHYLIQAPLPIRTLFLSRFIECVSFSSWASAFLGSPLILAYGITSGAHWGYYLAGAAFYLPFVTIPAAIGAIITLILVRIFPRLPRIILFALAGLSVALLFTHLRQTFSAERLASDSIITAVLQATSQTQSPLMPSYWASQGILSAGENRYGEALFLLLLLLSNALLFTWLATETAHRLFLPGFNAIVGGDRNYERPLDRGLLGRLDSALGFIRNPIRPLVVKDIKLFWRDPTQWTQFVIFFGIMAVYVANLGNRSMGYQSEAYRGWIAGLNNAACALILASLTSRFIYPLISLEGFRFWILGLAPLTLRQLMRQKFWLSVAATAPFTIGLVILSSHLLSVGPIRFAVAVYSILLANLTLAGLAVGLGSIYPNFQEDNPARIVSGMGGTLNFLLSVGYITVIIGGQMLILQANDMNWFPSVQAFWWTLAILLLINTLLSLAFTLIPMKLGLRNLQKTEF